MADHVCDWCDKHFSYTPPKGMEIKEYTPIYCSSNCQKLDRQFIKFMGLVRWRKDDGLSRTP